MASVSAVGAVIACARGDSDTAAAVMDREAEISPEGPGEDGKWRGEGRGGRGERRDKIENAV